MQEPSDSSPSAPKARIKVCHMVVLSHLTGVQRVMFDLIRPLDPERYERHVICHGEGPLTEELEKNGIQWHAVPSLVRPIHPWHDTKALFDVRKLCKKHGFDIVHTHSSKTGLIGRVAARWTGVPIVLHHVHGFSFHEYSKPGVRLFFSQIEKFAGRFTDRIVFVNREEREMTVDHGWASAEKCVTVYNGTDLDKFDARHHPELRQEIREKFELAEGEVAILVCGRLDHQKQCLILPEIAAALDKRLPDTAWRIMVAGTANWTNN